MQQLLLWYLPNGDFSISTVSSTFNQNSAVRKSCLFSPICLLSCLFTSVLTHGYCFILQVIVCQYSYCSDCPRFGDSEFLQLGSFVLSTLFLEHMLTFDTTGCSGFIWLIFLPQVQNQPFLQGALIPFPGEWYLEMKIWVLGLLMLECYCFQKLLTGPGNTCTLMCICTCLSMCTSVLVCVYVLTHY